MSQSAGRLTGPAPHHVIQHTANEQKEQQRNRGIKVGLTAANEAFIERHACGEENTEQIGTSMLTRLRFNAPSADMKNGRPAKATAGTAMSAEM